MRTLLVRLPLVIFLAACSYGRFNNQSPADNITSDEFATRRQQILEKMSLGDVALFHSSPTVNRNDDVDYPYRQESDFYYLTGWEEPEAILILQKQKSGETNTVLFVRPRNPHMEIWTGFRQGPAGAMALDGIDTAFAIGDFHDMRGKFLYGAAKLILSDGGDKVFRADLDEWLANAGNYAPAVIQRANTITAPMRLIKSDTEVTLLQEAIDITGTSLIDAWAKLKNLDYEWQLAAEVEYGFKKQGAQRLGFPSIVGSGKNSTILHYETNRDPLDKSGLVVMDVGAEYHYYTADVTRTVPVDGAFSPEQGAIYELVLKANRAAIDAVKPGINWREPHNIAVRVITEGLVELGLLEGEVDTLIAKNKYRKFFMHGTSHWLGLDVHDVGGHHQADGSPWELQPGMVLTIEPGIYIRDGLESVDPKWYNIGVRIEDDVLVTKSGHKVLSGDIPKTVKAIEQVMR
ncbi:MAG: aminopeptidase P N-terminal domain-containing protein [Candidatus Marinimicrobia bacterium]|nr:aminopeptidase P N-terminal domain-containing protein [Candidatus Neomarinimicrobiota bacterium]